MSTSPTVTHPADPDALARSVAALVAAHPAVARLDGGVFGAVATHLPGRRLVGVRIGQGAEPVEIGVVLHLQSPIPGVVRTLRREVAALCTAAGHPVTAVDVTVADVAVPAEEVGAPAAEAPLPAQDVTGPRSAPRSTVAPTSPPTPRPTVAASTPRPAAP